MELMTAFGWLSIMLLIGIVCRAKIKLFRNILMPASVIAGCLGFLLLNMGILQGVDGNIYNDLTAHLFTLSFISIGLTSVSKSEETGSSVKNMLKGSIAIGAVWVLLWSVTPLLGYLVLKLLNTVTDMHAVYGLLIPTAFCDGPGTAIVFGNMFESYGWENASQIAVTFAVIGFFYAFGVGVPLAKWGVKKGLAKNVTAIDNTIARGLYRKQEQHESLGMATCYSGNIDTLAFHLALVGACFIGAKYLSALCALIPGSWGEIVSSLMFMHGLIVAYIVRWIMEKLNVAQYKNDTLQARITGTCTDMLVCSAFMAIQISIIGKWLIPILIVTFVAAVVTFGASYYFGSRIGGPCDFERTLGIWGCATGTCPTGIALIRIVDPNLETTAATELGAMNVVAMVLSLGVYVAVPSIAKFIAEGAGFGVGNLGVCIVTVIICLVVLKIFKAWGKPTYHLKEK